MNEAFSIQSAAPEATRRFPSIVDAARERFRHFGYAKTSMREIAADCGMSAANLYRFHPGKLAIASAVVERERRLMFAACDEAIASAPSAAAPRLSAFFLGIVEHTLYQITEEPLLFELGMIVTRETPAARTNFLEEIRLRITAILGESFPAAADLPRATELIQLASAPFVLPWMLANQPFGDVRPRVADLVRCLINGLRAGGDATP